MSRNANVSDFMLCSADARGYTDIASAGLCCRPPLSALLRATSGQGLQISGQLTRPEGKVFYNLKFENHSQIPLDTFMIQFNRNTFGLAAGGPLPVHMLICLFKISKSS